MNLLFGIIGVFAFGLASAIYGAWLATDLWLWFIVPLGASPISVLHMYGLFLIIGLLKYSPSSTNSEKFNWEKAIGQILSFPIMYTICWFFGKIAHNYM